MEPTQHTGVHFDLDRDMDGLHEQLKTQPDERRSRRGRTDPGGRMDLGASLPAAEQTSASPIFNGVTANTLRPRASQTAASLVNSLPRSVSLPRATTLNSHTLGQPAAQAHSKGRTSSVPRAATLNSHSVSYAGTRGAFAPACNLSHHSGSTSSLNGDATVSRSGAAFGRSITTPTAKAIAAGVASRRASTAGHQRPGHQTVPQSKHSNSTNGGVYHAHTLHTMASPSSSSSSNNSSNIGSTPGAKKQQRSKTLSALPNTGGARGPRPQAALLDTAAAGADDPGFVDAGADSSSDCMSPESTSTACWTPMSASSSSHLLRSGRAGNSSSSSAAVHSSNHKAGSSDNVTKSTSGGGQALMPGLAPIRTSVGGAPLTTAAATAASAAAAAIVAKVKEELVHSTEAGTPSSGGTVVAKTLSSLKSLSAGGYKSAKALISGVKQSTGGSPSQRATANGSPSRRTTANGSPSRRASANGSPSRRGTNAGGGDSHPVAQSIAAGIRSFNPFLDLPNSGAAATAAAAGTGRPCGSEGEVGQQHRQEQRSPFAKMAEMPSRGEEEQRRPAAAGPLAYGAMYGQQPGASNSSSSGPTWISMYISSASAKAADGPASPQKWPYSGQHSSSISTSSSYRSSYSSGISSYSPHTQKNSSSNSIPAMQPTSGSSISVTKAGKISSFAGGKNIKLGLQQQQQQQQPSQKQKQKQMPTPILFAKDNKAFKKLMLMLLLIVVAVGGGVGAWAGVTHAVGKHERAVEAAAAAAALNVRPPLAFKSVASVSANNTVEACTNWFGDDEHSALYRQLFSLAYSTGLKVRIEDVTINSISCAGAQMYTNSSSQAAVKGPRRSLLHASHKAAPLSTAQAAKAAAGDLFSGGLEQAAAATAAARSLMSDGNTSSSSSGSGSGKVAVEVVTIFSVPAPAHPKDQAQLVDTVATKSTAMLALPMSQFFGGPFRLAKKVEPLDAESSSSSNSSSSSTSRQLGPAPASASVQEVQDAAAAAGSSVADVGDDSSMMAGRGPVLGLQRTAALEDQVADEEPSVAQLEAEGDRSSFISLAGQSSAQDSDATGAADSVSGVPDASPPASDMPSQPDLDQLADGRLNFDTAPTCLFFPTETNSVADTQGRLWSRMNGKECVFRPSNDPDAVNPKLTWDSAPTCTERPHDGNSVVDDHDRLWGWEGFASCAFRVSSGVGSSLHNPKSGLSIVSFQTLQASRMDRVSVVWEAAPACTFAPTISNTVPDKFGRLWSWEKGKSCAFK